MLVEADIDGIIKSIKDNFAKSDRNGDGLISKEELSKTFKRLGEWSDEEFNLLFSSADVNSDGKLSFNEFIDWVFASTTQHGDACPDVGDSDKGENEEQGSDWWSEDDVEDWRSLGGYGGEEAPWKELPEDENIDEEGKFIDEVFPATETSLGAPEHDAANGECWVRLGNLAEEGTTLFNKILPCDINQGKLGNCWFLAAAASVASYPEWVKQIFGRSPGIREEGKYIVRLWHPGREAFQFITVSDEVPATEAQGKRLPLFASPTADNEIWPCVLEKAFAKMSGSYAAMEGGWTAWGLTYLCGGQGEEWNKVTDDDGCETWERSVTQWQGGEEDTIERDGSEEYITRNGPGDALKSRRLWKALLAYTRKNFPMGCEIEEELDEMHGLVSGHCYSFMLATEVRGDNGKILRLCKLRNPRYEKQWDGKWSDGSSMWGRHPSVRNELSFAPKNDNSFWMSFQDFRKYFCTVSVCKTPMPLQDVHDDKLLSTTRLLKMVAEQAP
mmetsp:Transcript_125299/g.250116  ORF Transcript_125299/g.250116 Transcript_125299/m.250116 type:complete len:500 (-) Transcript_125299:266-1765(-)